MSQTNPISDEWEDDEEILLEPATIETPDQAEALTAGLEAETAAIVASISSPESAKMAVAFRNDRLVAAERAIGRIFDPICDQTNRAHKAATGARKALRDPIVTYRGRVDAALVGYERKVREAEEAAQKAAEEEARKALEAAHEDELEDLKGRGASPQELETVAAEQKAELEAPPVPVAAETPKAPAGVNYRTTYSAEVVDLFELVRAVAAGNVPIEAISANMTFLNQQARSLKTSLAYPGVKAKPKRSVAKSGGR